MTEYDVFVEDMNPCGGSEYSKKEFISVETDDPEEFVKGHSRYPIMEKTELSNGDLMITTGNGDGYFIRYIFSE